MAGELESWRAREIQPSSQKAIHNSLQLSSQKYFFNGIIAHNTYINGNTNITGTLTTGTYTRLHPVPGATYLAYTSGNVGDATRFGLIDKSDILGKVEQ